VATVSSGLLVDVETGIVALRVLPSGKALGGAARAEDVVEVAVRLMLVFCSEVGLASAGAVLAGFTSLAAGMFVVCPDGPLAATGAVLPVWMKDP